MRVTINPPFHQSCAYHDHLFYPRLGARTVRCGVNELTRASPSHRFRGPRPIAHAWILDSHPSGLHGSAPLAAAHCHCARPAVSGNRSFHMAFFALLVLGARGRRRRQMPKPRASAWFGWVRASEAQSSHGPAPLRGTGRDGTETDGKDSQNFRNATKAVLAPAAGTGRGASGRRRTEWFAFFAWWPAVSGSFFLIAAASARASRWIRRWWHRRSEQGRALIVGRVFPAAFHGSLSAHVRAGTLH
jgi:hypothetical protein